MFRRKIKDGRVVITKCILLLKKDRALRHLRNIAFICTSEPVCTNCTVNRCGPAIAHLWKPNRCQTATAPSCTPLPKHTLRDHTPIDRGGFNTYELQRKDWTCESNKCEQQRHWQCCCLVKWATFIVFFTYTNYSVGKVDCALHYLGRSVQQLCTVYLAVPRLISPTAVQQNCV